MNKFKIIKIFVFLAILIECGNIFFIHVENTNVSGIRPLGKGSTIALNRVYQQWKLNYQAQGGREFLTVPLRFETQDLGSPKKSSSQIKINVNTGEFIAFANDLPSDHYYNFWLEGQTKQESGERSSQLLGVLKEDNRTFYLKSVLSRTDMQGLYLNRVVIKSVARNKKPTVLLTGSPSLFQISKNILS
jgi:hypothetical protein